MPALPALDGVDFRMFRGPSDYPHFVRIINAWARGEGDERVETVEGIASGYDHLERCDPTATSSSRRWTAAPSDTAASGGTRSRRTTCLQARLPRRPGAGRPGNRRGRCFAWNESRLREIAASTTSARRSSRSGTTIETSLRRARTGRRLRADHLLRRDGAPDRRRSPRPSAPRRSRDPAGTRRGLRTIWEADVEAFRDHWGYVEPTEADYQRFLACPVHRHDALEDRLGRRGRRRPGRSFIDTAQNAEHGRSAAGPRTSRPRAAGAGAESRRRSSSSRSASSPRAG